jgi:hypothetical protein
MGYCTRFELKLIPFHHEEAWEAVAALDDGYVGGALDGEPIKWYDHEDHMRGISKQFPGLTFKLSGEGEDAGDIWVKYFRNGKMQSCKAVIEIPPFDEGKLR